MWEGQILRWECTRTFPKVQDKLNQNLPSLQRCQAHVRIAVAVPSHSLLSGDVDLRTTDQAAEEQVKTAREALQLARQRYKLRLGSVMERTQSEVPLPGAETRLADAQYDYKIAEVMLAYAAGLTASSGVESVSL